MTAPVSLLVVGCGYLGERVAQNAVARGMRTAALTRSASRAADLTARGIAACVGDILQPETLRQLPSADVLLYAVGWDRTAGASPRTVTVEGVRHVLEEMRNRVCRLVYISSTSVYGQSAGEVVNEESPCEPTAENGQICLAAERLVRQFFPEPANDISEGETNRPRRAVILRLAGIYGPGRLIARVSALRAGEPVVGDPEAWLNLIHASDAVTAIEAAAFHPRAAGTYLVSDARPLTRREFYSRVADGSCAPPPRFVSANDLAAESTPGVRRKGAAGLNKRCDSRRIQAELQIAWKYPDVATGLSHALEQTCE